jgi:hypothetical protein
LADYTNWGVDTADIALDNADGWSDGTVLMQPGAPGHPARHGKHFNSGFAGHRQH